MCHRASAAVSALLLLSACAPAVESATFESHPPRPADAEVRIYRSQQPDCAFQEIGLLVWRPQSAWDSLDEGVAAMRQQARKMGGDAILDFRYSEPATGIDTGAPADSTRLETTSTRVHEPIATGTVIRYLGDGC